MNTSSVRMTVCADKETFFTNQVCYARCFGFPFFLRHYPYAGWIFAAFTVAFFVNIHYTTCKGAFALSHRTFSPFTRPRVCDDFSPRITTYDRRQ